ncbi:MAG: 30S ribosomal protein S19e [Candidatus Aenigmatarchaeota archaeon]
MVTVRDVEAKKLIDATVVALKAKMQVPEWAMFVKTGCGRERPPDNGDWWHVRAASLLRRIYLDGPVGVQRLRSFYGNLKRRGHKPSHFREGSGKVLRVMLQDFEKLGYIEQNKKGKKGRIITPLGQKFLDNISKSVK